MVGLWRAVKGFEAHRGFFLAAGLSFYFLICLIPLLLFLVAAAGFVLPSETANRAVVHQLPPMVPVLPAARDRTAPARAGHPHDLGRARDGHPPPSSRPSCSPPCAWS